MEQNARTCSRPRLLVSVRSAAEARAALAGGCEILDVKEPKRGSMGMADVATIASVVEAAKSTHPDVAISAALGDVTDWTDGCSIPAIPEMDFVKLGPSGTATANRWIETWCRIQQRFNEKNGQASKWVAVAYVDWTLAAAPTPDAIVEAVVAETGKVDRCAGVLFDTYAKTGRTLLDWISGSELATLADRVHSRGLMLAVAGSLHASMLQSLKDVQPDVIAIRTAACADGQRTGNVASGAVRDFATSLSDVFATSRVRPDLLATRSAAGR